MSNRRYRAGQSRQEPPPFSQSLDDYISAVNAVRSIDAFVESLDLADLGFRYTGEGGRPANPPYPPGGMLKLYIYGYLNRVRSSRRLEQETHRNIEAIWLLHGLKPSYKTIAEFRKVHPEALRRVNREFVLLCKELDLFGGKLAAIDGSFFRANASKASVQLKGQVEKELERIEKSIDRYLGELQRKDEEDDAEGTPSLVEDPQLKEKLEALKARQAERKAQLQQMEASGEGQLSHTDPDARRLSKRGQSLTGYNVQQSVDDKHGLIVEHAVTNDGNDEQQLEPMAMRTQETLGVKELEVAVDAGYYNGEQIKNCVDAGLTPYVPVPNYSRREEDKGRYPREAFRFDAELNVCHCPGGAILRPGHRALQIRGRSVFRYTSLSSTCTACPDKGRCLPDKTPLRTIHRWEHEAVLEEHQARMERDGKAMMRQRSALAEHPFGTMKRWLGWDHFLLRGFDKVRGEMALYVFGYNFRRVLTILGIEEARDYFVSRRSRPVGEGAEMAPA